MEKIHHVTAILDSKSVFDMIRKESLTSVDRKSALELSVIKSQLESVKGCVRWIPHELNASDALTKLHGHAQPLLDLLTSAKMMICDEQKVLQERKQWREENSRQQNPRPKQRGPTVEVWFFS